MPLDGTTSWHPNGWTIRVGPDPRLLSESRHWAKKKLRVFHKLALAAAYGAIDAIQFGQLYGRRHKIWCRGSWIRYYFRLDHRQRHTILITISHFHFLDTDPKKPGPGHRASMPIDPLVLHVSGSGRLYKVDRIEGIPPPLPQPPARNLIITMLDALRLRGNLQTADMPYRGIGLVSPAIESINGQLYYSPRRAKTSGRFDPDLTSHNKSSAIHVVPKADWLSRLGQAFKSIRIFRKVDSKAVLMGGFEYDGVQRSFQGDDPGLSRVSSHTHSIPPDRSLRPRELQ